MFAAGSTNKKAIVFSCNTGETIATFVAKAGINAVVFAGVGSATRIIAGTFNAQICMWHIESQTAEPECELNFGNDAVLCMAVGARGTRLAVGGAKSHVAIYALEVPRPSFDDDGTPPGKIVELYRCAPHGTSSILSLAFDREATLLVTGGESKLVHLFDLNQDLVDLSSVAVLPGADGMAPAPAAGADAPTRPPIKPLETFRCSSVVHSVSLTAGGDNLAVGLSDCTEVYQLFHSEAFEETGDADGGTGGDVEVRLVRTTIVEPLLFLDCPAQQGGVAFSKEGGKLAIGGSQLVTVFDIISGGTILKQPRDGRVRCVALTSGGSIVVVGGFDRKATLHNIDSGTGLSHFTVCDDVVRSVHLSADSSRLAIGSDMLGKGYVCLYDVNSGLRLGEWEHPKAVWCVRLAPNGRILAAAGYDMKMTIYDTVTFAQLYQVGYPMKAGPAFIWSMDFARDSKTFCVGVWNGGAYLYSIAETSAASSGDGAMQTDAEGDASPIIVTEMCVVQRKDRVYAVALDETGRHLCIGGRDKACALYERAEGGKDFSPLWEAKAEDFVYCVALSADLTYCAYGGTMKAVIVLDGRTGVAAMRIDVPGTVWTISLLHLPGEPRLAIGGELPTITLYDLKNQCDVLQLPVDETTFAVVATPDSIAFTNGNACSMYGKGGMEYAWRDPPSFGVVASLIMTMLGNEEELLHCTKLIIDNHPAVVNSRDPETGASLLQFVISNANRSRLLDILLASQCRIGLQADMRGRTCLHQALENGKWHSLQQLLDALRHERFSVIPGSMRLVAECFEVIASDYPLDFLHYIGNLNLQHEPEVLGDIDAFDVMLPSTLISGSSQRCPKGLWAAKLEQYSRSGAEEAKDGGKIKDLAEPSEIEERSMAPSFLKRTVSVSSEASSNGRPGTAGGRPTRPGSARPGTAGGMRSSSSSLPTFKAPPSEKAVLAAALAASNGPAASSAVADAAIEMGFNKVSRGGLQAMRVPIENFAGLFETSTGQAGVAPLQLIVDAVNATGNYAVFNSQLLRIILEFKWYGFAQRAFYSEVCVKLWHVTVVQYFNLRASAVIDHTLADILGVDFLGKKTNYPGSPEYLLIAAFVWTSGMILVTFCTELRQIRGGLLSYLSEVWNWIDWVYIIGQFTINVLFVTRDFAPNLLITRAVENGTVIKRMLAEDLVHDNPAPLMGGHHGFGLHDAIGEDWIEGDHPFRRVLKAKGSSGGGEDIYGETYSELGPFVVLQSFVVVTSTLRLLYFFKGNLRLGALVHTLFRIVIDILPLMTLVVVFLFAFTGSMMIMVMHELQYEAWPKWHAYQDVLLLILNAGLYTATPSVAMRHGRHLFTVILYLVFMIFLQIILLNMIIAVMAESHSRVSAQSELVAQKGRAELILEYEQAEVIKYKARAAIRKKRRGGGGSDRSSTSSRFEALSHDGLFSTLTDFDAARLERVCPRWLHVLMPAEHSRGEDEDVPEELKELRQLKRQLAKAEEALAAKQTKMLESIGKRDEVSERQKILQAVRVELSQFKEDVLAGVRAR